jgi:hypothetical protein
VYDGTVTSVFINGVLSATNSISSYTFATNTNSIIIGTNSINESYDGDIDELRIWNTNRSICEINGFMNCEIPTNATNLIANYHFNQGVAAANNSTVTTLFDATTNGNNGTLNNFALTGATGNWVTPGGVVSSFTTSTLPAVTAVSSATNLICVGQSATLTAGGANTYTWNTAATTSVIVISPTVTTNYTVTGTNALGCSNAAIITQSVSACTSLANQAANFASIEIFPNPSSDFFNLKVSSEVTIEVFNVLGNVILTTTINSGEYKLNLTEQSNGLYIIKCTSQGQVKSYRIIKD